MIRTWNLFYVAVYVTLSLLFYNIILYPMLWSNQSPAANHLLFCHDDEVTTVVTLNVMRTILVRLSCGKNSKYISTAAVNQWDSRAHEEEVQVQYLLWTMINGAQSSDEHDQHAAWESLLWVALKYNTEQTISRRLSSLQSIVPVLCGNILYTLMFEDLNCILVFK